VYRNNRTATRTALENGKAGLPRADDIAQYVARPTNPFYQAPEDGNP
jgi:5,6,7,8-tetrahydromethanopterin hydro-lyase